MSYILFFNYINSAPDLRNDHKLQKIRITQLQYAQFLYGYDIFWMLPGESSCPDGLEYEWQRGVGGVKGGRS